MYCNLQVETLMEYLLAILDTPTKLDLLQDVRLLLPPAHVTRFDTLAPYNKMANPPSGYTQQASSYAFVVDIYIKMRHRFHALE